MCVFVVAALLYEEKVMVWSWLALIDTLMRDLDETLIEWATAEYEEEWASSVGGL